MCRNSCTWNSLVDLPVPIPPRRPSGVHIRGPEFHRSLQEGSINGRGSARRSISAIPATPRRSVARSEKSNVKRIANDVRKSEHLRLKSSSECTGMLRHFTKAYDSFHKLDIHGISYVTMAHWDVGEANLASARSVRKLEVKTMKPYLTCLAVLVALGLATRVEAGPTVTLDISYSGPNLGVSGTGVLQAISAGNGEYDAVSGYIDAVLPGIGTVHETLVANPNAPNFAATAVFSNANGDNFVYDDRIFIPYNSPASTDGASSRMPAGSYSRPRPRAKRMSTCRPTVRARSAATSTSAVMTDLMGSWATGLWARSRSPWARSRNLPRSSPPRSPPSAWAPSPWLASGRSLPSDRSPELIRESLGTASPVGRSLPPAFSHLTRFCGKVSPTLPRGQAMVPRPTQKGNLRSGRMRRPFGRPATSAQREASPTGNEHSILAHSYDRHRRDLGRFIVPKPRDLAEPRGAKPRPVSSRALRRRTAASTIAGARRVPPHKGRARRSYVPDHRRGAAAG